MSRSTNVAGLVLAGGGSSRFGRAKALVQLHGRSLLSWAALALQPVCISVAVSAPASSAAAELAGELGLAIVCDRSGGPRGPLAGILAGLEWATKCEADLLLVRHVDTPLLPNTLALRLVQAVANAPAAYCHTQQGPQPLCSIWSVALLRQLHLALRLSHPSVHRLLDDFGAIRLEFDGVGAAFININFPGDLRDAVEGAPGASGPLRVRSIVHRVLPHRQAALEMLHQEADLMRQKTPVRIDRPHPLFRRAPGSQQFYERSVH